MNDQEKIMIGKMLDAIHLSQQAIKQLQEKVIYILNYIQEVKGGNK